MLTMLPAGLARNAAPFLHGPEADAVLRVLRTGQYGHGGTPLSFTWLTIAVLRGARWAARLGGAVDGGVRAGRHSEIRKETAAELTVRDGTQQTSEVLRVSGYTPPPHPGSRQLGPLPRRR